MATWALDVGFELPPGGTYGVTQATSAELGVTERSATVGTCTYMAGGRPGSPGTGHMLVTGRRAFRYRIGNAPRLSAAPLFDPEDGGTGVWFYPHAIGASALPFLRFNDSAGVNVGNVSLNTAWKLQLVTDLATSDTRSHALTPDEWCYLEKIVDEDGTLASVAIVSASGRAVLDAALSGLDIVELEFGVLADSGSTTMSIGFDDLSGGAPSFTSTFPPLCLDLIPGAPTPTSLQVGTWTQGVQKVRILATGGGQVITSPEVSVPANGHALVDVPGLLNPATKYALSVEGRDPNGVWHTAMKAGAAKTMPASDSTAWTYKIVIAGCQNGAKDDGTNNLPNSWVKIDEADPDLISLLGDVHYSEVTANKSRPHTSALEKQWTYATYMAASFRKAASIFGRSDHDGGGPNNSETGGEQWTLASIEALSKFAPHYELPLLAAGAMYQSTVLGGVVKIIWSDFRNYARSNSVLNAREVGKTAYGSEQLAKLLDEFTTWPGPILWMDDAIWMRSVLPPEPGRTPGEHSGSGNGKTDTMASYQLEQEMLAEVLAPIAHRIVRINGDAHALTADDGSTNLWGGFPVLGAAGQVANTNPRGGLNSQQYFPPVELGGDVDTSQWASITLTRADDTVSWHFEGWNELAGVGGVAAHTKVVELAGEWSVAGFEAPTTPARLYVEDYDITDVFRVDAASRLHKLPSRTVTSTALSGLNGVITSGTEDFDPLTIELALQLNSDRVGGAYGGVPAFDAKVKALWSVLAQKGKRKWGWRPRGADAVMWELRARSSGGSVVDQAGPEFGKAAVTLQSDEWCWRSPQQATFTRRFGNGFDDARLDEFDLSNVPITDAFFLIEGPVNGFTFTDYWSQTWFRYGEDDDAPHVLAGEFLKIDCGNFTAWIDDNSSRDPGPDAVDVWAWIDYGGNAEHLIELTPAPIAGNPFDVGVLISANVQGGDSLLSNLWISAKQAAAV